MEVWAHKTCLTHSLLIKVPGLSQESKQSCICVLAISILPVFMIFKLDFVNVPVLFCVFHFMYALIPYTYVNYSVLQSPNSILDDFKRIHEKDRYKRF